jgi:hypothetical protein
MVVLASLCLDGAIEGGEEERETWEKPERSACVWEKSGGRRSGGVRHGWDGGEKKGLTAGAHFIISLFCT